LYLSHENIYALSCLWQLPVLVTPLLRHCVFLLFAIRNLSSRFYLSTDHHASESILEQVALRFQETQRITELVWKDYFKWCFWDAKALLTML
jgi:hypothetical protein